MKDGMEPDQDFRKKQKAAPRKDGFDTMLEQSLEKRWCILIKWCFLQRYNMAVSIGS